MDGVRHTVAMPVPSRRVLHRGRCLCGWVVHYDQDSWAWATGRADDHLGEHLAGRPT